MLYENHQLKGRFTMMDHPFFTTDVLAYTIIGLCACMVIFGLFKIVRVYSLMKFKEHNFIDIHAIYDVFKQDVKKQAGNPRITADNLVMQELYLAKIPLDRRYMN